MSQELAVKSENSLATKNHYQESQLRDIIIPKLIILHEAKYGLPAGTMIDSVDKQKVEGTFIPLFTYKSYVKFDSNNKSEWSTNDITDPRVQTGLKWNMQAKDSKSQRPEVTEFLNFVVVVNDDLSFPSILGFKASSLRIGRTLNTTCLRQSGEASLPGFNRGQFANKRRYNLVVREEKGKRTYWVPDFTVPQDKNVFVVDSELQIKLNDLAVRFAPLLLAKNSPVAVEDEAPEL